MRKMTILLVVAFMSAAAWAQQVRDGGDTARLQAQIQQLTVERAELQERNRELEAELEKSARDLEGAQARIGTLEARIGELEASLQQSGVSVARGEQLAAQQRERMDELVAEFRSTIEVLRMTELELNETRAALASVESERDQCVAHNLSLYRTGIEVLERYEQKGCFESVRQNEPFAQIKRVELENLVDEYRWRFEDELLPANTNAPNSAEVEDSAVEP